MPLLYDHSIKRHIDCSKNFGHQSLYNPRSGLDNDLLLNTWALTLRNKIHISDFDRIVMYYTSFIRQHFVARRAQRGVL
jgi:hypothetical protein